MDKVEFIYNIVYHLIHSFFFIAKPQLFYKENVFNYLIFCLQYCLKKKQKTYNSYTDILSVDCS